MEEVERKYGEITRKGLEKFAEKIFDNSAGGRNLNGYSDKEMAEMFSSHSIPQNIVFEYEFSKMIKQ